jgi:SAM-dependent methyltransferase
MSDRTRRQDPALAGKWERIHAEGGFAWREVHPDVVAFGQSLLQAGSQRILDIGCGEGRHVVDLAQRGARAWGCDVAMLALRETQLKLRQAGVAAGLCVADMTRLPLRSGSFDGAVAFNVLYHGRSADLAAAVAEIRRVLREGGRALVTYISDQHPDFGMGQAIEPGTYLLDHGADAGIPHHFCGQAEIENLMADFEMEELRLIRRAEANVSHWLAIAAKRKDPTRLPPVDQDRIRK